MSAEIKLKIENILKEAVEMINKSQNLEQLQELKNVYLGRKRGKLTEIIEQMASFDIEQKKAIGQIVNNAKLSLEKEFDKKNNELLTNKWNTTLASEKIDITEPVIPKSQIGHLHPISIVQKDLEDLFTSMGFMVLDGPDLESDYCNFEGLNMPKNHPSRDSQDTFYIKGNPEMVMRTQISSVQVRALKKYGAPTRIVFPGKCFRNEATDAAHEHTFHQFEGLVVEKNVSIANLISMMRALLRGVFGKDVEVRLRPGHFPFVEPGFELDMRCLICHGKGCGACKNNGWIETLPCGLVHPKVLEYGGVDPNEWSGFAFCLGLTRTVMQKYEINDIRLLMSGDTRFLSQF